MAKEPNLAPSRRNQPPKSTTRVPAPTAGQTPKPQNTVKPPPPPAPPPKKK